MALTKVTGKGLETLSDGVTITTADNLPQLTLKSTDADGGLTGYKYNKGLTYG